MPLEVYYAYSPEYLRDMDRNRNIMYYPNANNDMMRGSSAGGKMNYSDGYNEGNRRGYDDGYNRGYEEGSRRGSRGSRSERARRGYEESQKMNNNSTAEGKEKRMRELNTYMDELSEDMKKLIKDMSQEERSMFKNKINKLETLV